MAGTCQEYSFSFLPVATRQASPPRFIDSKSTNKSYVMDQLAPITRSNEPKTEAPFDIQFAVPEEIETKTKTNKQTKNVQVKLLYSGQNR